MSTHDADDSEPIRLKSELSTAKERFLSRMVDHVLQDGWRSPEDFLRHFPPAAIVESLADVDDLRVKILVEATGANEKLALKKSVTSASEDLALALEEQLTTPGALVELYPPDDRVRHLDATKLWDFLVEDEFWTTRAADDKPAHTRAAERMTFMLEAGLEEELITLKDVADGMTFNEISTCLPVMELQEVVKHALQIARADAPLTEERLLAVVPLSSLVEFVPLDATWARVVVERVAVPAGFAAAPVAEAPPPTEESAPTNGQAAPKSGTSKSRPPDGRPKEEDAARRGVVKRLKAIDRLPPGYDSLSTPILLSTESMYADLESVTDDDEREATVRESFPNEAHLRAAMLGLIELLDPSVDTKDPVIHDAEVEGLIKIVLFEERRRAERPKSSRPQASKRSARRSVPPPLPKSQPPPLPDEPVAQRKS